MPLAAQETREPKSWVKRKPAFSSVTDGYCYSRWATRSILRDESSAGGGDITPLPKAPSASRTFAAATGAGWGDGNCGTRDVAKHRVTCHVAFSLLFFFFF